MKKNYYDLFHITNIKFIYPYKNYIPIHDEAAIAVTTAVS